MKPLEEQYASLHWAYSYLGKPYVENTEGPDTYDCWGLVREICAKRIDCDMPLLNIGRDDNYEAVTKAIRGWEKIEPPYQEYDILTMRTAFGRHIGICIKANGQVMLLHAEVPQVQVVEIQKLAQRGYKDVQGWRYTHEQ